MHKPQGGGKGRQSTVSKISMRAGLFIGCSIIVSTPSFAQTSGQPEAEAETTEAIVVVGSRIEGSKIAETLPVSVLSEDRIAATGSVSCDDLFRSIPQAGDVQFQEARTTGNLNDARGDNSSINLRSALRFSVPSRSLREPLNIITTCSMFSDAVA